MLHLLLIGVIAAQAQPKPASPLMQQTFTTDAGGWIAMGGGTQPSVAKDASSKHGGMNSLAFQYEGGKGGAVIVLPVEFSLQAMEEIRFWLKTDVSTPIGMFLSEKKPGGDYSSVFWSPRDSWQQIVLRPSDFSMNDGPNDPKDPNGTLDLDAIQGIGLLDLKQMFAGVKPDQVPFPIDPLVGAHQLLINDFQISPEGTAEAASVEFVVIDDFRRAHSRWITLGGMELAISPGSNPLNKPALEASYQQTPGRVAFLNHRLASVDLSQCKALSFDIASKKDAQIAVSIEMQKVDGKSPRYMYLLETPGGSERQNRELPFADFVLDENSPPDPAGKFDPSRIRTISLLDMTGTALNETIANTFWLADVKGVVKK